MMEKIRSSLSWQEIRQRLGYYVKQQLRPAQPATRPGMGAVAPAGDEGGVSFRVWAPHAERVFVMGSFNDWSPWRTPLAREKEAPDGMPGSGTWSAHVPEAAPGDRYRFLIHYRGERLARTDPYARAVEGPYDDGVVVPANGLGVAAASADYRVPARDELIIYELHVGTFAGEGTFADVVAKLPYLEQLGINAIELMPVATFPGERSWGYNPAHLFAVAARYGGPEALRALIAAAHARGIAVLVDVVFNHFGPDGLSLWRFDGWHENGSGGIYFYNDWRSKTPWGHTRPDYGRPEVRRFIRDNVFMWLASFAVDGLRWDATSWIRNAHGHDGDPGANIGEAWQMMQEINTEMEKRFPARLRIAEDMQDNAWLVKDVSAGGAHFDTQWDARFVHVVREALIDARDEARDMDAVAAAIRADGLERPWQRVIFTESHDEVANGQARVPEEIAPGNAGHSFARQRAALGAGLVFTAPGIPMLFQGQEFLMSGWFDDREPLPWKKAEENRGTLRFYQDLIRLRRDANGVSRGLRGPHVNVFHVDDEVKLIAYHRWDKGGPGDDVIVVANFANRTVEACKLGLPREGVWHVRLNSADRMYGGDARGGAPAAVDAAAQREGETVMGMPFAAEISVAPYALLLLSQG